MTRQIEEFFNPIKNSISYEFRNRSGNGKELFDIIELLHLMVKNRIDLERSSFDCSSTNNFFDIELFFFSNNDLSCPIKLLITAKYISIQKTIYYYEISFGNNLPQDVQEDHLNGDKITDIKNTIISYFSNVVEEKITTQNGIVKRKEFYCKDNHSFCHVEVFKILLPWNQKEFNIKHYEPWYNDYLETTL